MQVKGVVNWRVAFCATIAAVVLSGAAHGGPKVAGNDWKCVYSSAEGPEGRALAVLTQCVTPLALRDCGKTTSYVLPMEREGAAEPIDRRNKIVVGRPSESREIARIFGKDGVPAGGYAVRAFSDDGCNVIALAGDTPEAVLWAAMDFAAVDMFEIAWRAHEEKALERSPGQIVPESVFSLEAVPSYARRCAPETKVRSLFTWGHVIDDYRQFFCECAKLRLNRVLLWNEYPPVNARDVVREAHSWGIEVYWSFAWGWSTDCRKADAADTKEIVDGIVREWRETWRPLGGDGIYFQTFTERRYADVGGRSVAARAVEVVNEAARRIWSEDPGVNIVFGLHSQVVKATPDQLENPTPEAIAAQVRDNATRLSEIEQTDPAIEILWENCGGFAFNESTNRPDVAFADALLASGRTTGFAWKAQLRQDWSCWEHQSGPYMLGEAGASALGRDRRVAGPRHRTFDAAWHENGVWAWEFLRHVRAGANPPRELNLVTEYNPPFAFSTVVQAELAWSSAEPWQVIRLRALSRCRDDSAR